mgnify:CR=1 FL=1
MKRFHLVIRIKNNNQIVWQKEMEIEGRSIGEALNQAFDSNELPYSIGGLFNKNLHLEIAIYDAN